MTSRSPRRRSTRRQNQADDDSAKSPFCGSCGGTSSENREGTAEAIVSCSKCNISEHPSCLGLTEKAQEAVRTYEWQCQDCKACMECENSDKEDQIIICDDCDRACHTYCASPRLVEVPKGAWKCGLCKGMRIRGRKSLPPKQACPFPGCNGEGSAFGNGTSHTSLDECPMHLKSLTSPRKGKRNSIARGVDGHAVANHDEASSPVNKRVRLATADATSGSETRGSAPRVKLLLSTKKTKAKTAGNTVPTEVDPKQVPFGGRLTESDADISTCIPTVSDRARFKKARMQAEKVSAASTPDINPEDAENGDLSLLNDEVFYAPAEPKIKSIYFGTREINTWYSAPYPEEYNGQSHIYICEYCFKYMKSQYVAGRHKAKCPLRHPPGDEIYRDGNISVFEVDGRKNKIYCQNLCLLAKMFLDHKTLYYDVEPFLFYILTENDERGCHFVGYFSKEKRSSANYNLSCIVTMPISQRKGYGGLLIEFSYLLSRKEGRTGSPEKPLSDLGLVTYRRYWRRTVLRALHECSGEQVSIEEVSQLTCMTPDDIIHTLHLLDMLKKNAHGDYVIRYPAALINSFIEAVNAKNMATVKPDLLRWTPLLFKAPMVTVAEEPTTPDTPVVANTDANELEGEGEESHKDIEDPPSGNEEETA